MDQMKINFKKNEIFSYFNIMEKRVKNIEVLPLITKLIISTAKA